MVADLIKSDWNIDERLNDLINELRGKAKDPAYQDCLRNNRNEARALVLEGERIESSIKDYDNIRYHG